MRRRAPTLLLWSRLAAGSITRRTQAVSRRGRSGRTGSRPGMVLSSPGRGEPSAGRHPARQCPAEEMTMLFELRQYRLLPGQRDNWVRYMEEVIIPFQVAQGMVLAGSFVAEEAPDLYGWIP